MAPALCNAETFVLLAGTFSSLCSYEPVLAGHSVSLQMGENDPCRNAPWFLNHMSWGAWLTLSPGLFLGIFLKNESSHGPEGVK